MKTSRYLAAGELLFIIMPLALIALWATLLTLPLGLSALSEGLGSAPVVLLGLFCCASFFSLTLGAPLIVRFIRHGSPALLRAPKREWLSVATGVFLALAGGLMAVFGEGIGFAIGLPALIPALHLYLERGREMANNSFKPNPLRGSA
jgi:hypothetical protein